MTEDDAPWSLTIPSDLRLLALARTFIASVCELAGLDEHTTSSVVLACDEAANNVMRHAHLDRPDAMIQIDCRVRDEALEIVIHDQGEPFDLAQVPHLDPSELRVGGRGVFLMRTIMDELTCERRGDRGNTLRMVKFRPRSDSA